MDHFFFKKISFKFCISAPPFRHFHQAIRFSLDERDPHCAFKVLEMQFKRLAVISGTLATELLQLAIEFGHIDLAFMVAKRMRPDTRQDLRGLIRLLVSVSDRADCFSLAKRFCLQPKIEKMKRMRG